MNADYADPVKDRTDPDLCFESRVAVRSGKVGHLDQARDVPLLADSLAWRSTALAG